MLKRGLLKLWLGASIVWLIAVAGLSWLGYHEAIFSTPAPQDAERLCAQVEPCRVAELHGFLLQALLSAAGVPAGLFLAGLLLVWAVDGPPWRR
ncbi:hypothetical protein SAMN06265365_13656 [Tistlia consotensis]|uniref:Vitamin K epoxide reductase family protein n=1 Tax=Tistlia consotensis USBA 355 TaxID=560819 RepID=A0A1Y6CPA8_9PROT|nr:hypothetical protein [Tistlia consotensis]SMF78587.1 hypothetical protein SAMN05428998_13857 [Tistlia consotensis USBA 355]SNS18806.1 hypothetical protein SAMN06265365_13656 [Tistlia consotensis]